MLSRTADHLFWLARYIERAENLARLLDITWQTSLVPQAQESARRNWQAALLCHDQLPSYVETYQDVTAEKVLAFMVFDPNNPSSIYSCLKSARENAHAVRGTLTQEMWETINATWLEMLTLSRRKLHEEELTEFFEWVKTRSSLSRGVTFGTMLHDEAFYFIRLGTYIERADSTARLLDVKYYMISEGESPGTSADYYQWGALLRSVSAFEIYRRGYRGSVSPSRVADLLITRADMPRSLNACIIEVEAMLEKLANRNSKETQRLAGQLSAQLRYADIEEILAAGLHPYLEKFQERVYDLGMRISHDFLLPMRAA
ncbi:MAG: alpha-E domain-containing protein [Pseudomonadota bacterium]